MCVCLQTYLFWGKKGGAGGGGTHQQSISLTLSIHILFPTFSVSFSPCVMASQPFLKGPFGAPLRHEVNGRWELVPVPDGYVSPPAAAIGAGAVTPASPVVIVLDSSESETEEDGILDPEVIVLNSSDSEGEDPMPVIAGDNNNNANNNADVSDDDGDVGEEQARDVIHVEPFMPALRHPACRRRANQLVPCTVGERGCRMAVAILALDAGELLLHSDGSSLTLL